MLALLHLLFLCWLGIYYWIPKYRYQNAVESICGDSASEAKTSDDGNGPTVVIYIHNML